MNYCGIKTTSGFLATGNALPMTTANRTSGAMPLGVFFDAVDTTSPVWSSGVIQPSPSLPEKTVDSQPVNITGATVAWVSNGGTTGTGTLTLTYTAVPVKYELKWAAPGDVAGSNVEWTVDATKVLTSANGQTIGLLVDFSALPAGNASDSITIGSSLQPDYGSYYYEWDFGDPGSGRFTAGATDPTGMFPSKNSATGFVAAHVYETAGNYTITLRVTDETGVQHLYTQTITVLSEPVAGWTTYYFATAGNDFTGDGSIGNPYKTWGKAYTLLGTNVRLRFNRGDTFTDSAYYTISPAGPGMIDSYGTGAKPIFSRTGTSSTESFWVQATDWRFVDVAILGNAAECGATLTDAAPSIKPSSSGTYMTLLRVTTSGSFDALGAATGTIIADCNSPSRNHRDFYGSLVQSALLGNDWGYTQAYGLIGGSHVLRCGWAHKAVIQSNNLLHPCSTGSRQPLKFHGTVASGVSKYTVISDNLIDSGSGGPAWVGPQDNGSNEALSDIIVERNFFTGSLYVNARKITIRNNIFTPLAASTDADMLRITHYGIEPTSSHNVVYNNSFYSPYASLGSGTLWGVRVWKGDSQIACNNALSAPLWDSTGPYVVVVDAGADCTASNNIENDAIGWVNPSANNFRLGAGSILRDAGNNNALPWCRTDWENVRRPQNGTMDIGASEYRS